MSVYCPLILIPKDVCFNSFCLFLYTIFLFPLVAFNILNLSVLFKEINFHVTQCSLFHVSYTWVLLNLFYCFMVSIKYEKLTTINSSIFFLLFLFYYLLEIQIIHIFGHLKLSHSSQIVCLFMFSLLSLCNSLLLDFKFTNIAVFCFLQLLVHCLFHSALLRSCKFISKNVLLLAFNIFYIY